MSRALPAEMRSFPTAAREFVTRPGVQRPQNAAVVTVCLLCVYYGKLNINNKMYKIIVVNFNI